MESEGGLTTSTSLSAAVVGATAVELEAVLKNDIVSFQTLRAHERAVCEEEAQLKEKRERPPFTRLAHESI